MDHYGGVYRQSGRGLGSIFSALGRMALPFLKRTAVPFLKHQAKRLGPKAIKAGVGMINDITTKKKNIKQAARARGVQFIQQAINTKQPKRKRQSKPNASTVKTRRKDIFG